MDGKFWFKALLTGLLLTTLVMAGCEGDDGSDGAPGAPGAPGADGQDGLNASEVTSLVGEEPTEALNVEITSVQISTLPVVNFTVTDSLGRPAVGMFDADNNSNVRFVLAGLTPGDDAAGVQSSWDRYLYERASTEGVTLVDNQDGTYSFTFATDIADVPAYDPTLVTRLSMQIRDFGPTINPWLDFIPAGGTVTPGPQNRDIVTIDACNSCHGALAFHGGGRVETTMCVTCHNEPTLGAFDMTPMIHKIHAASADVGGEDFSEVTYPQDLRNCTTCHQGADSTAWVDLQNAAVCTQCHTAADIGVPHTITETTPSCNTCHPAIAPALDIAAIHTTVNATAHNPDVPAGLVNFTYELVSASVDASNVATIEFRLLANGEALTALPDVANFTGSPSLLFAYAQLQDGIAAPADFNNFGNYAAQPVTASLTSLGANLTNTAGVFTAVVADAFPVGATLRTVGLQGYFTQVSPAEARHTTSDVITVTGDEARRSVVSSAKCAACHEFFEGHGGNRVFSADGGVQICTTCHVPNLSSGGRTYTVTGTETNSNTLLAIEMFGADASLWPEDTNNFKDLIHGIHAATDRPYEFVRIRGGNAYPFDWSEVTFPGILNNCATCHDGDTYVLNELPTGLLNSTVEIPADAGTVADARATVPNSTDFVNTPISSACFYCHDSDAAASHMNLNGGQIDVLRANADATQESCIVCHGSGSIADVETAHGL